MQIYNFTITFSVAAFDEHPVEQQAIMHGMRLGYVGDWAVICHSCAATHKTQIVKV